MAQVLSLARELLHAICAAKKEREKKIKKRKEEGDLTLRERRRQRATEVAEAGVMPPGVKAHPLHLKQEGTRKISPWSLQRENSPADTLISAP